MDALIGVADNRRYEIGGLADVLKSLKHLLCSGVYCLMLVAADGLRHGPLDGYLLTCIPICTRPDFIICTNT